jgi:uncharacterized protein (TIGR03435 family)
MLQSFLAERFQLKIHREMNDTPVYALVVGKSGPKFKESSPDADPTIWVGGSGANYQVTMSKGSMEDLAQHLSGTALDGPVVDKTGLTGVYNLQLTYKPEFSTNRRTEPDLSEIDIFTAVQDQLGLRLEAQKAPLEILVVDRVEHPTEN